MSEFRSELPAALRRAALLPLALAACAFAQDTAGPPADDPSVLPSETQPLATQAMILDVAQAATRAIAVGERGEVLVSESRREWRQVLPRSNDSCTWPRRPKQSTWRSS